MPGRRPEEPPLAPPWSWRIVRRELEANNFSVLEEFFLLLGLETVVTLLLEIACLSLWRFGERTGVKLHFELYL
jgi:hypothetical protein